jgi:hypothetical protein
LDFVEIDLAARPCAIPSCGPVLEHFSRKWRIFMTRRRHAHVLGLAASCRRRDRDHQEVIAHSRKFDRREWAEESWAGIRFPCSSAARAARKLCLLNTLDRPSGRPARPFRPSIVAPEARCGETRKTPYYGYALPAIPRLECRLLR